MDMSHPPGQRLQTIATLLVGCWAAVTGGMADAADPISGHLSVGGRNVSVAGDDAKFKQQVNLDSGARLFDFGFVYEPAGTGSTVPDRIEAAASGLGGDPYQSLRLGVRKYGSYRFTYERSQSDYFYEDIFLDPADESATRSNGGDYHHFDFQRIRDSADLDVQLTDQAKLLVGFDQYTKKGDRTTVLDLSREEFEMDQSIDETLQNYDIGLVYDWNRASVRVNQRWRQFDNDVHIFLPGASEGSAPGAPTRLDSFFLEQPYGYDSRETQAGLTLRPTDRWDVQADVLYADLDMDVDAVESVIGLDYLGNPLPTPLAADGASNRTIRQVYLSTGYALTGRLRLTASIRDQHLDQDTDLDFASSTGVSDWKIDNTTFALGMEAVLRDDWTVSGGWTTQKRDTDYDQSTDGLGRSADEETQADGYYLVVAYRPGNAFSASFSAEDNSIDDPFTLSSPTDSRRYRLRAAYRWDNGLGVSAAYAWRKHENDDSGWEAKSEQADLRLTYSMDVLSVSVGASFVDLDRSIDQQVQAGTRQLLLPISYSADSDFWDGTLRWHLLERVDLLGSYRQYENDGSFKVSRDDARLGVDVRLTPIYSLGMNYRNIDYNEDFESFDADIWEMSIGLRW
ncbi:MAG: hypothetical protein KDI31_00445 [Pseudomonadales bacterium]|nr:hypothetical protein [Pseudomonadales bacterium]